MKSGKKLAQLFCLIGCLVVLTSVLPTPILPNTYVSTHGTSITPCADILEWRFKTVNGITYMRLYNTSTHSWVGEWVPI